MAYRTVESIVKAAIGEAFKVYTNIPSDFIQQAVYFYNDSEPFIWRKWPWENRKIDEISVTPSATGIITFDGDNSDVDMVRAVKAIGSDGELDALVWNESDIRAAMNGNNITSDYFQKLSDDSSGYRRIKINTEDEVTTYKVLAFRRFVRAEVNAAYDAGDPTATPNDYRVLTWKIDLAEAPLVAYIADELNKWKGREGNGKWIHGLNGTIKDLREQEATEQTISPKEGVFGDQGNWW